MNVISVKMDLNFIPDYDWGVDGSSTQDGNGVSIEDRVLQDLGKLEMGEWMIHTWSWGVFEVSVASYEELPAALYLLDAKIAEVGKTYNILLGS